MSVLRAPFPWFGGKSRVSHLVWPRFGNVLNYVEPFFGSGAVLLQRPHIGKVETVNDLDAYLANFWRALQAEPEHVAWWADYPINETDLHARHRWLVSEGRERVKGLTDDPGAYDVKVAGWWVWGQCLWIGSGWCQGQRSAQRNNGVRPALSHDNGIHTRRFQGGGLAGGSGVHAPRLSQQIPRLSGDGSGEQGLERADISEHQGGLIGYMRELSARMRRVRVTCGDWTRVLGPSVTTYMGTTAVFFDPPYDHDLRERCYAEDHNVSDDVRQWAIEHGDDPKLRIALCGYDGEHEMPRTWEVVKWKAKGGYSRTKRGVENRERERIWFSPHCLRRTDRLQFDEPTEASA